MKKRLLSLVLALTLLLGLQTAALAAPGSTGTSLVCQTGQTENGVDLSLAGLNGGVYGVQVELALRGQYPQCTFTSASGSGTAYSPDCTVSVSGQETRVTIYLTDESPLNSGSGLALGTLRLGAPAGRDLLPSAAQVKLLNYGLSASVDGTVPVTDGAGTGPSQPGQPGLPSGPSQPVTPVTPNTPSSPSQGSQKPGGEDSSTQKPDEGPDYNSVALPFVDVNAADWFCEAVRYVYARGMMGGTGTNTFSPGGTVTRGQIAAILHRLAGEPVVRGSSFSDVPASAYYGGAVAWAARRGIVEGFSDGTFRPDLPVSRQQLAVILWRYAGLEKADSGARASLQGFPDAGEVGGYAREAMGWALAEGILQGTGDGTLQPQGRAARGQTAVLLERFQKLLEAE